MKVALPRISLIPAMMATAMAIKVHQLGVTAKVYAAFTGQPAPIEVMQNLTVADVAPIYKQDYWDRVRADDLPSGVDWAVFDWQVNSGNRSAKALQRNVGATADGAVGPMTLQAVATTIQRICSATCIPAAIRFIARLSSLIDLAGAGRAATLRHWKRHLL